MKVTARECLGKLKLKSLMLFIQEFYLEMLIFYKFHFDSN